MKFNIYIANHGKPDGIEDFIQILLDLVRRNGYEVTTTKSLNESAVNIVIDEFTNYATNREIESFKNNHPEAVLIFVLTEFIESKLLVKSFNFFDGLVAASIVSAIRVYIPFKRKDFEKPTKGDWLVALIYSPVAAGYWMLYQLRQIGKTNKESIVSKIRGHAYLLMRYLGLKRMVKLADAVVLSHPKISESLTYLSDCPKTLGVLYPEINYQDVVRNLFRDKTLMLEVTGSITTYRHKCILNINRQILLSGMHNSMELCKAISFGHNSSSGESRGAYSLHPPQSEKWKYSSPTRIYRALQYDGNMPVLTKTFNQHPIEELCIVYEGEETLLTLYQYYNKQSELIRYIRPKIERYNEVANSENVRVLSLMEEIVRKRL